MTREEFKTFQNGLPRTDEQNDCAMVDVTYECGAGCDYCYAPQGSHRTLEGIALEIEATPQARILLTGGEPLLHPYLDDVVEMCRVFGKKPHLLTNGGLLTQKRLFELIYHGLEMVDGVPQVAASLQFPDYCNTFYPAYENLEKIIVDNVSFTVDSVERVKQVKYLATSLKGSFRAVCIRTAWPSQIDTYDVVQALGGNLLDIPAPYGDRSASVEHNGIHYKVISWPSPEEYDSAIYDGRGVWYKGNNVVSTLCRGTQVSL